MITVEGTVTIDHPQTKSPTSPPRLSGVCVVGEIERKVKEFFL